MDLGLYSKVKHRKTAWRLPISTFQTRGWADPTRVQEQIRRRMAFHRLLRRLSTSVSLYSSGTFDLQRWFTEPGGGRGCDAFIAHQPTRRGWLHLAITADLHACRIVDAAFPATTDVSLVILALEQAWHEYYPGAEAGVPPRPWRHVCQCGLRSHASPPPDRAKHEPKR